MPIKLQSYFVVNGGSALVARFREALWISGNREALLNVEATQRILHKRNNSCGEYGAGGGPVVWSLLRCVPGYRLCH